MSLSKLLADDIDSARVRAAIRKELITVIKEAGLISENPAGRCDDWPELIDG
jgi:hypothetical protein